MARITGRVEVVVDSKVLLNKAGAIARGIGVSGKPNVERRAIVGDTGLHGFVEDPVLAECEVKVSDRSDIMLSDFALINGNGTVIFRAVPDGKEYIMREATCTGNFELTAGDGETTLRFVGPYWTESSND